MDLKHIIPQQRRRSFGPSFDIAFSTDKSNVSRVGPNPVHSRASSGTFVNENGLIVGKTRSTTSLNPASVRVGGVAVFAVPSGSVVGWLNNSVVVVMEDTDGNDQIGAERHVTGTLIHKTDTAITLLVTSKSGTTTLSSWFVSYRGLRIDHDPATGLCLGHLHESSRTNTVQRSQQFSVSPWLLFGVPTITDGAIISPSGFLDAAKFTVGTTTTQYRLFQTSTTIVSGTTYTMSAFFKAGEITRVALYAGTSTTLGINAIFELTGSGTIIQNSSGAASIIPYKNGWYRCIIVGVGGANQPTSIQIQAVSGTSLTYVGNGVDSFYLWGVQLEVGVDASSYIPTTAATSAARSEDVCTITGTSFTGFYNQTEGTIYSEMRHYANEYTGSYLFHSGNRLISAFGTDVNPSASRIATYVTSGPPNFNNVANFEVAYTIRSRNKIALAVRQNDFAASYNGATASTDTSGVFPASPMTNLNIGTNTGQRMRGHIMRLTYYPQRFADTRLPTLTAVVSEPLWYNGVAIWYNGEGLLETS